VSSGIHMKCTKSQCFCSENTVKTHENTSKTVHFMFYIWYMCILVFMWNVPKVHVSAVKPQWKHMKTIAKQCISYIKYETCAFLCTCEICQQYMFLKYKHMKTLVKKCISCIKYGTCVFWNTCEMYHKYMFLQWRQCENCLKCGCHLQIIMEKTRIHFPFANAPDKMLYIYFG
jgi:hypothetical protein